MSEWKVRGTVHVIEDTKTYGQKGFRKRLVVLKQEQGNFPNYIPIEFVKDGCDTVDELSKGDEIEVEFRLSGREWQKDAKSEVRYFLNVEALRFDVVNSKGGTADSADGNRPAPDEAEASFDDDEVPF